MNNLHNHNGFTLTEVIFSIMLLGILGTSLFIMQGSMTQQVTKIEELMSVAIKVHNAYIQHIFKETFQDKTQTEAIKEYPDFSTDLHDSEQFENLQILEIEAPFKSGRKIQYYYPVMKNDEDEKKDEKAKNK